VYADTDSSTELKVVYEVVNNGDYKEFKKGCEGSDCKIVGIWDDHDFGNNNLVGNPVGSSEDDEMARAQLARLLRSERKALLVEFLGEPTKSEITPGKTPTSRGLSRRRTSARSILTDRIMAH
jgi:hypothetical protein